MSPNRSVSKRKLGADYIIIVGFIFTGIVFWQAITAGFSTLGQFLLLVLGVLLTLGMIGVGLWLRRSPLEDERVLLVAQWGALGIAFGTGVIVVSAIAFFPFRATPGLFVTVIGTSGVVGTLLGSVKALEEEHENLKQLYGRNQVLQRVLRHNIRNGMTVVQGYASLLEDDLDGGRVDMVRTIRQEASSIVDLSEMARNLQTIEDRNSRHPMNISSIVEELLNGLRRNYPNARVDTSVPPDVYAVGDNFIELALWEVLEYSVRHDAAEPVEVIVTDVEGSVSIRITDPGGPIPEESMNALRRGAETQMEHLEGMELWVAKWLVENVDGDIEFERTENATETTIRLPSKPSPAEDESLQASKPLASIIP
ncbi:MAG: sensor histidine kinase [Halodesulfurarchaeum sp.]